VVVQVVSGMVWSVAVEEEEGIYNERDLNENTQSKKVKLENREKRSAYLKDQDYFLGGCRRR